jgi:hypothetical protein
MTAQVIPLVDPAPSEEDREALRDAITELHALITLDPILGVSAVRVYFVVNPTAKARIAASIDPADLGRRRTPSAYALVAYDFPFALHQLQATSSQLATERAKEVVCRSAGLQGEALRAAAEVTGLSMRAVSAFDAGALKSVFFPSTQETVIQLFRLELGQP